MQLRLSFPLAVPSLPGSTGWLGLLWGCISRRAHDPGHPPAVSLCWEAGPILQWPLPCPCPWAGDSRVDIRRRMLTLVSTSLTCLRQRWEKWVSHRQWWISRMAVGPYLSSAPPPLAPHILCFGVLLLLAGTLWELPVRKDIFVPGERISVLSLPHRALAAA